MPQHPHKGSHLDQGGWGAGRSKAKGDHLDATGEGGAKQGPGPKTSAKGGAIAANVKGPKNVSGSHLVPYPAETDKTADRQGGTVRGHDRVDPTLGKAHSDKHVATRVI